jgi:hypothetical protein
LAKQSNLLIFILTIGVFGIINTEMATSSGWMVFRNSPRLDGWFSKKDGKERMTKGER